MLKGKIVLITGGARGIGRALALAFAQEGCAIALNYRSGIEDSLLEEICSFGVECLPIQGDISDFDTAKQVIETAHKHFGRLDVLINNAGITRDTLLMRMKEEAFDEVISTNLKGSFHMIRHIAGILLKQRSGAIINMSSVVGVMGNIGQANYAASKAGLIGLTKSTARELGSRGVTCNAIAPGFIETDMTAALSEELKQKMLASIPLGRFGTAKEVADAAIFLAKHPYITGQTLHVDGGMAMC